MNKLTPEQAIADIRAVRRDHSANHWFACACVLADELEVDALKVVLDERSALRAALEKSESLFWELEKDTREKERVIDTLRAELDAIKTEPDANPAPALSRFLPCRPTDVSAPPDGWVYGAEVVSYNDYSPDISQLSLTKSWMIDSQGYRGTATREHYAIRWTAAPDIWHRFGLLAPSEGGGWIPHTPGDAMPCGGGEIVRVLFSTGAEGRPSQYAIHAADWAWGLYEYEKLQIIGWRPLLAEVAT
jgi:hypothetical protein